MYRKLSGILFPVACLALVISLQWGTTKQGQLGKMKIEAENQYQRSFHDFVYQVGQLDDLLGKSEAIDGKSMLFQRSNAVQLARLSSEAQNAYHQLPVSLLPDTNADDFFTAVYQFAHQLATAEGTQRTWTTADQRKLHDLHQAAATFTKRMQHLQQVAIRSRLKWTDAEIAYAQDGKIRTANTLYDGFHQLNTALIATRSAIAGPHVLNQIATSFSGPRWTQAQIKKRAQDLLGTGESLSNIRIQTLSNKSTYPRYMIHARSEDGSKISASFTQQGGHLLWFKRTRVVGKQKLQEGEVVDSVVDQLAEMGFKSVTLLTQDRYDGVLTLQFASRNGDVTLYPHRFVVQAGLDRGDLLGIQVSNTYYNSTLERTWKPKLSVNQAKSHVVRGFVVQKIDKATMLNQQGEEVLAYVFSGQKNQHQFTVYVDANTGQELHIDTEM